MKNLFFSLFFSLLLPFSSFSYSFAHLKYGNKILIGGAKRKIFEVDFFYKPKQENSNSQQAIEYLLKFFNEINE
jgi:hypothetical protein